VTGTPQQYGSGTNVFFKLEEVNYLLVMMVWAKFLQQTTPASTLLGRLTVCDVHVRISILLALLALTCATYFTMICSYFRSLPSPPGEMCRICMELFCISLQKIHILYLLLELSIKSSKESTEPVSLLKTGNKVVEVG
jgi:hypothetical protein